MDETVTQYLQTHLPSLARGWFFDLYNDTICCPFNGSRFTGCQQPSGEDYDESVFFHYG